MTISSDQKEVVFQGQRCNPKIVVRDRGSRPPELNEDTCVVFRSSRLGSPRKEAVIRLVSIATLIST